MKPPGAVRSVAACAAPQGPTRTLRKPLPDGRCGGRGAAAGRLAVLVVGLLAPGEFTGAQEPVSEPAQAAGSYEPPGESELLQTVARLGAAQFADREAASEQLLLWGAVALPLLREAEASRSPEVRYRAGALRREIEQQLLETRIKALEGGRVRPGELAAWDEYRAIAGDSSPSRQLFTAMLRAAPEALMGVGGPDLPAAADAQIQEWLNPFVGRQGRTATFAETAALVFLASQPEIRTSPAIAAHVLQQSRQQSVTVAMSGEFRPVLQALFGAWAAKPEPTIATQRLQFAAQLGLPQGVAPAREILADALTWQGHDRYNAIMVLARFGGPEHVHELEQLLDDEEVIETNRTSSGEMVSQVRDVALAALWRMHHENPASHGFVGLREDSRYLYRSSSVGFRSEDDRLKAIAEWRRWRLGHVKDHLPPDGNALEGVTL